MKHIFPITTEYAGPIEGSDNYNYDLLQTTSITSKTATFLGIDDNIIIAKHFQDDVITREKIIEFDKNIIKSLKTAKNVKNRLDGSACPRDVLRVVCIGNKYDSNLDDESYLEDVMNETALSQIDLLVDHDTHFDIKWLGIKNK